MCKLPFVSWLCCSIHRGTGPICIYSPVTMWQKSSNWLPALQNGFKNLNRISPEVHSDLSNSSVTNYMNISCRALLRSWATVNVISCLTCRDMSKWHIYLSPLTEYVCVCVCLSTLMTTPMMGSVRIRPGWGVGQRSISLQAVDQQQQWSESEITSNRPKLSPRGHTQQRKFTHTRNVYLSGTTLIQAKLRVFQWDVGGEFIHLILTWIIK